MRDNVTLLAGAEQVDAAPWPPFDPRAVDFLAELSAEVLRSPDTRRHFVGTAQSAENVSTAYHDAYLYSQFVDFFDLSCVLGKAFLVDAVLLFTHQALAAEFQ